MPGIVGTPGAVEAIAVTLAPPGREIGSSSAPRSAVPVVVVLVLLGVFGGGLAFGLIAELPALSGIGLSAGAGQALRRSAPTDLSIPSLGLRARVVEVGQASDGSIQEPPGDPTRTTGWYGDGPTPGEPGAAVIVGHVDTESAPAVFHRLGELGPGEVIEVTRRDRRAVAFAVESVRQYPKTAFPVDLIFDDDPTPRLVLVTCGGAWVGGEIGYADNIIVFATRA